MKIERVEDGSARFAPRMAKRRPGRAEKAEKTAGQPASAEPRFSGTLEEARALFAAGKLDHHRGNFLDVYV